MHAAQHDAVNGAQPRYETYASTLRNPGADPEAAAAAAAHQVLVAFFTASQSALDDRLAESLAAVPDGNAEDAGVTLGRAAGDIVLQARADDGYGTREALVRLPRAQAFRRRRVSSPATRAFRRRVVLLRLSLR
jgi:hypothetical protein